MTNEKKKTALTLARKRLIELMQKTNFGRIENLEVLYGEPVFDPPPTAVRLFLFGRHNKPNASLGKDGITLKKSATELFEILDREQSLTIRELLIDDGLPVRMTVARAVQV